MHLVLGSGLGGLAERVEDAARVPFSRLPGFPRTSVEGHEGCFVCGRLAGVPVLVQAGRFHFYEGVGAEVVAAPVRVGRALGAATLVLTNAAGGDPARPGSGLDHARGRPHRPELSRRRWRVRWPRASSASRT